MNEEQTLALNKLVPAMQAEESKGLNWENWVNTQIGMCQAAANIDPIKFALAVDILEALLDRQIKSTKPESEEYRATVERLNKASERGDIDPNDYAFNRTKFKGLVQVLMSSMSSHQTLEL